MRKARIIFLTLALVGTASLSHAQYNNSGISAGFFDSSENATINFSSFHLPPLSVLFENAKQNPQILTLAKAQEIAQAEVAKQKRHIFSYVHGHASYSYGKTDMWGQGSTSYNLVLQQFQGSEQSYWNVGVNLNVPLEDILDLGAAVKRKKLAVDQARIQKDLAFDRLKQEITTLYIKITNNLVALKTSSEAAAIYQGAGALNQEDFHQGNMSIEAFAQTKMREIGVVQGYQSLQTEITTDIITLEILTHTPILTNTTTDINLEEEQLSEKEIKKQNRAVEKKIKKAAAAEEKRYRQMEEAEKKAEKKAAKAQKK
ncbi:Outer membrane efflux protein [Prevotella sp. tc2-28]|uniref:TolC family protein n=1 Tax=Prevotella sp. tc2-28 TaxID=1761888 RepID=UPI00089A08B5|nr:TolC family protein [Prevotella sp. tc2-28]SEA91654.1 Outer membrane efflux protein [Prevotella sp. tc2-28]